MKKTLKLKPEYEDVSDLISLFEQINQAIGKISIDTDQYYTLKSAKSKHLLKIKKI